MGHWPGPEVLMSWSCSTFLLSSERGHRLLTALHAGCACPPAYACCINVRCGAMHVMLKQSAAMFGHAQCQLRNVRNLLACYTLSICDHLLDVMRRKWHIDARWHAVVDPHYHAY